MKCKCILAAVVAILVAGSAYAQSSKKKNSNPPPTMSCEQMSANSHGSISLEACQQMMGAQQALTTALADPRASKPGDDTMTCEQIVAEIKQQPFTAPDSAKVTEAQEALDDQQKTIAKEKKEAEAMVIKETAEASLVSTLVPVNAVAAAEAKRIEAEQKAANERMAKELTPKMERSFNALGSLTEDMGKTLTANPRLAKLFQLANAKRCKVQ